MYKSKTIGVVVPAYNEELLIGRVITTMPDFVDKIVIVDDCSPDRTAEVVREYQQRGEDQGRIMLIRHEQNLGVGGAIATGYTWCRDHNIDIAVVMAGDAQMDPEDLPSLLDPIVAGEVDYTKGNRLFSGEAWRVIPRVRYLGNSVLSLLTKMASGYWQVADSQCGYTAINQKALKVINWQSMYRRYGQPNDLLVRLNVYGFRVRDVPVRPVYNIGEKSGIRPLAIIPRLSLLLFRLFLWRMYQKYVIRDFHPLIFFYLLAAFLLTISLPLLVRIFVLLFATGRIPPINTMTFIFTAILGMQSLFFAMLFDMEYDRNSR